MRNRTIVNLNIFKQISRKRHNLSNWVKSNSIIKLSLKHFLDMLESTPQRQSLIKNDPFVVSKLLNQKIKEAFNRWLPKNASFSFSKPRQKSAALKIIFGFTDWVSQYWLLTLWHFLNISLCLFYKTVPYSCRFLLTMNFGSMF